MKPVYLVILNITSWRGMSIGAEHYYGKLILSEMEQVTLDTVDDWNINYLGDEIEVRQLMTLEMAKQLDKKDGFGSTYVRSYMFRKANPDDESDLGTTNRFDTIQQVIDAGIKKFNELKLDCPFICLYEGEKFSDTVILNKK